MTDVTNPTARILRTARWSALVAALLVSAAAEADAIPASVRACAHESDSLKRLVCFDREIAKYPEESSSGTLPTPPAAQKSPAASPQPTMTASTAAAPAPAQAPAPDTAKPQKPPKHISARIVSMENAPDAMIVHLDNGQAWQQIQEASATPNLHPGDTVSIDRELLAYWLSGSDGVAIKVRQRN